MEGIDVRWRAPVDDDELSTLHARAFTAPIERRAWSAQLDEHSLGWVRATDATGRLVGFANVAWDGGVHAFLLDVVVDPHLQRAGIATRVVALAISEPERPGARGSTSTSSHTCTPSTSTPAASPRPTRG